MFNVNKQYVPLSEIVKSSIIIFIKYLSWNCVSMQYMKRFSFHKRAKVHDFVILRYIVSNSFFVICYILSSEFLETPSFHHVCKLNVNFLLLFWKVSSGIINILLIEASCWCVVLNRQFEFSLNKLIAYMKKIVSIFSLFNLSGGRKLTFCFGNWRSRDSESNKFCRLLILNLVDILFLLAFEISISFRY